jgi:hypothetical protein
MTVRIENDVVLSIIKKGNTYFDILLYNCCEFEKINDDAGENKIIIHVDKDKLNLALDDIAAVYDNLLNLGMTLSGYQFIGLTLERNLQESATFEIRFAYFILCLGFLISMFGVLLSFVVVEYIKGLRDETCEFIIVGIKSYKIIFKLSDIILYGDSILFVAPINILIYNVIDFYFGVIFNVMSMIIFVLGVYFHYKIIISRQIYLVGISNKEECFESDIFGRLYSYIYKINVEVGNDQEEELVETEIETITDKFEFQRKKNQPMKFITNG